VGEKRRTNVMLGQKRFIEIMMMHELIVEPSRNDLKVMSSLKDGDGRECLHSRENPGINDKASHSYSPNQMRRQDLKGIS
jgi:hypothetical protein